MITEILGQFLIFIISKCVSVIVLTYMHVPYRGLNTLFMRHFLAGQTRG